jgi:hypothetical protein
MFQSILEIPTTHSTAINCDANREFAKAAVAKKE